MNRYSLQTHRLSLHLKCALLLCLPLLATGCCQHQMRKFDVSVSLDDSVRNDSTHRFRPVEINLIAVSDDAISTWENKPVTDYFKPTDSLRRSTEKGLLRLGPDVPSATFSKADPIWDMWKSDKAMTLFVLCDFPRQVSSMPGEQDPRRRELPLDQCRWGDQHTINIVVKSDGLTVLNSPRSP